MSRGTVLAIGIAWMVAVALTRGLVRSEPLFALVGVGAPAMWLATWADTKIRATPHPFSRWLQDRLNDMAGWFTIAVLLGSVIGLSGWRNARLERERHDEQVRQIADDEAAQRSRLASADAAERSAASARVTKLVAELREAIRNGSIEDVARIHAALEVESISRPETKAPATVTAIKTRPSWATCRPAKRASATATT